MNEEVTSELIEEQPQKPNEKLGFVRQSIENFKKGYIFRSGVIILFADLISKKTGVDLQPLLDAIKGLMQ